MNNDKYTELMNKAVDGVINSKEQQELDDYLSVNLDEKQRFEQMKDLDDYLALITEEEPPSDLKSNILNSINSRKYTERKESLIARLSSVFTSNFKFRYAYTFAAGMVVGIIIFVLILNTGSGSRILDPNDLTGTLLLDGQAKDFKNLDEISFKKDNCSGTYRVDERTNLIIIQVNVISQDQVTLDFFFSEGDLVFKGFRQLESHVNNVSSAHTNISLVHKGSNQYVFVFERIGLNNTDVVFEITSEDILFHRTLQIQGGDR